jgi:hypothetical protein
VLGIDFDVPNKIIRKQSKQNLETKTYTPPPDNVISQFQWTLKVNLKLSTGAKLCVIRFLVLLHSSKHPGMAILYILGWSLHFFVTRLVRYWHIVFIKLKLQINFN